MAGQYAVDTKIDSMKTRNDIEKLLMKYGATGFLYGSAESAALIGFTINNRQFRIVLPLPDRTSKSITHHSRGVRNADAQAAAYEQACRSSWRSLFLIIKAKLEAVATGISTVEREFLPDLVMPDGQTVSQWAAPQVEQMYLTGRMPALLPMLEAK